MGTGFHGNNGISPQYSVRIYMTYVIPRLMYGLEVVTLKSKHITSLESFHRKTIRELQSLPIRTAKEAVYLLSGIPPLECILDSSIATLHIQIGKDQQHPLTKSGLVQLSTKALSTFSQTRGSYTLSGDFQDTAFLPPSYYSTKSRNLQQRTSYLTTGYVNLNKTPAQRARCYTCA